MIYALIFIFLTNLSVDPSLPGKKPLDFSYHEVMQKVEVNESDYFDEEFLSKSRKYSTEKELFYVSRIFLQIIFFSFFAFTKSGKKIMKRLLSLSKRTWLSRLLFFIIAIASFFILMLPLSLASGYFHEHAYNLSNLTLGKFFLDYTKQILMGIIIFSPLLLLFYFVSSKLKRSFVPVVYVSIILVSLFFTVIYQPVMMKFFYDFTELEDSDMKQSIMNLSEKAGIEVDDVLVMNASSRTSKGNAFFSGILGTERVVIYDTLLENHTKEEVLSIIAHEIGHKYKKHIWKSFLLFSVILLPLIYFLKWILDRRQKSGRPGIGNPMSLPFILLFVLIISILIKPAELAISREYERNADWISLVLTDNPETFIKGQVTLNKTNCGNPVPKDVEVILLRSHPPGIERIRMAEFYRKTRSLHFSDM